MRADEYSSTLAYAKVKKEMIFVYIIVVPRRFYSTYIIHEVNNFLVKKKIY